MKSTAILSPVNIEKRKKLEIKAGDTVRVAQKIQEKGKTRLQMFEGLILARKGGMQAGATFTVRRVVDGVGVEKTFPFFSPMIDQIELIKRSKVRQAKLYYIREKASKEIRKQMKHSRSLGAVTTTGSDIADKEIAKKEAAEIQAKEEAAAAEAAAREAEEKAKAEAVSAEGSEPVAEAETGEESANQ
jgi:large subunit ribosomal protein L19